VVAGWGMLALEMGRARREERYDVRASEEMKVCGPIIFPTQYPVKRTAPVNCFFVYPATLLLTIVKDMLKPNPWKKHSQSATNLPHLLLFGNPTRRPAPRIQIVFATIMVIHLVFGKRVQIHPPARRARNCTAPPGI
jgi:hypothetical protein